MTTFIASLFLPYTIGFETNDQQESKGIPDQANRRASLNLTSSRLSLLDALQDPHSNQDDGTNPFFTDPTNTISKRSSSHIDLSKLSPVSRPRVLARTDSAAPEWGTSPRLNQPLAQQISALPPGLDRYAMALKEEAAKSIHGLRSTQSRKTNKNRKPEFKGSEWTVEHSEHGNGGLYNAVKAAFDNETLISKHFVGTLGFPTDNLDEAVKHDIDEKLESEYDCLTVYVNDDDFDGHYRHYCKDRLWPVIHYQMPEDPKSKTFETHTWKAYVKVNEAFADRIVSSYKHGDVIWVHDYHLLLVPAMIKKRLPEAKIGFFLHTPFPSSELFRCLPSRLEILQGMLAADLVVFQAEEYVTHWKESCSHLLKVEATEYGVQLDDRFVPTYSQPLGVVSEGIREALQDEEVTRWSSTLQKRYSGKRLLVAVDKFEGTRGVRQKLLAYEIFLNNHPEWTEKVVLIQVAISTSGDNYIPDIADVVERIDAHHSSLEHQSLVFLRQDISFAQYLALLSSADGLLITSLRDGMNLACHEFVVCHTSRQKEAAKCGAVVLSEFTGAATVFSPFDVISVNPWDYNKCAMAIKRALELTEEDKMQRLDRMMQVVMQTNGRDWMQSLTARLHEACEMQQQRSTMSVPRLTVPDLIKQHRRARARLFILDYEGTLLSPSPVEKPTVLANPQRVIDTLLDVLTEFEHDVVYVMSKSSPVELEQIFHKIPTVGLIAEDGCFIRPFGTDGVSEDWKDLVEPGKSTAWKETIAQILNYYVERIDGSETEERHCSIVLSYANVKPDDLEAASKLAGDCANHLNDSCKSLNVHAIHAERSIVIAMNGYSRQAACAKVFAHEQRRLADDADDDSEALWLRSEPMSPNSGPSRGRSSTISSSVSRALSQRTSPQASSRKSSTHYRPSESPSSNELRRDSVTTRPMPYRLKPDHFMSPSARLSPVPQEEGDVSEIDSPLLASVQQVSSGPDFLMVAGDDREDEPVFRWANALHLKGLVRDVVTVSVGKRNTTEARYTLTQGATGLLNALGKLAGA